MRWLLLVCLAAGLHPQTVRLTSSSYPLFFQSAHSPTAISSPSGLYQCSPLLRSYAATAWVRPEGVSGTVLEVMKGENDPALLSLSWSSDHFMASVSSATSVDSPAVVAGAWQFVATQACSDALLVCTGQWKSSLSCKSSSVSTVQTVPQEDVVVSLGGTDFIGEVLGARLHLNGCLQEADFAQMLAGAECDGQCQGLCTGPGVFQCEKFLQLSSTPNPLVLNSEEKVISESDQVLMGRQFASAPALALTGWVQLPGGLPASDAAAFAFKQADASQVTAGASPTGLFASFKDTRAVATNPTPASFQLVAASVCSGKVVLCRVDLLLDESECSTETASGAGIFALKGGEIHLGSSQMSVSLSAVRLYPGFCFDESAAADVLLEPFPSCSSFCAVCSLPDACDQCESGFYLSGDGQCQQCSCLCESCSGPGSDKCLSCRAGTYKFGTKGCKSCPGLCIDCSADDESACLQCVEGASQTQTPGPCTCGSGYFHDALNNRCGKCAAGCEACTSLLLCDKCQSEYVSTGGRCLVDCPVGMKWQGNNCVVSPQSLAASFQLTRIVNSMVDKVGEWTTFAGSAELYDPLKDSMDPYAHYHEGMYFYQSLLRLPPHQSSNTNILLPDSHTLELWIRPLPKQDSVILFKSFRDFTLLAFSINTYLNAATLKLTAWDDKFVPSVKEVTATGLDSSGSWVQLAYTITVEQVSGVYSTSASIALSGRMLGTTVFPNARFTDFLGDIESVSFSLGCQSANPGFAQFFNGHIAEIDLYNANYVYVSPGACDCAFCSSGGMCLNDCLWRYYQSSSGCQPCLSSCVKGCVRGNDCILNLFPACPSYTDFDSCDCGPNQKLDIDSGMCVCVLGYWKSDSVCCHSSCSACSASGPDYCTSCAPGTALLAPAPAACGCSGDNYFDDIALVCKPCHESCATCNADSPFACLKCAEGFIDSTFGFCDTYCPTGFTHIAVCVAPASPLIVSLSFTGITNTPTDTSAKFTLFSGAKKTYYPAPDSSDPIPVYQGGLSFSGNRQYVLLPPNSEDSRPVTLSSSHSVELWVKSTGQGSTILSKSFQGELLDSEMMLMISSGLNLVVMLKVSVTALTTRTGGDVAYSVQAIGREVPYNQWTKVGYSVSRVQSSSVVVVTVNDLQTKTTYPDLLFRDYQGRDTLFVLGCDGNFANCYKGLVAEVRIAQGAMPAGTTTACGCPFCTSLGMCLNGCSFKEYFSDGACKACSATCPYGCRSPSTCALNFDTLCAHYSTYIGCDQCSDGAELVDGVCKCAVHKELVVDHCCHDTCLTCVSADEQGCSACKGDSAMAGPEFPTACICPPRAFLAKSMACSQCHSTCSSCFSASFFRCEKCLLGYMVDGLYCTDQPPTGYLLSPENVYKPSSSGPILRMQFSSITNSPQDSVSGFKAFSGSSAAYYPTLDPNDPMATYQAGFHFDGKRTYLRLPPNEADSRSVLLAPSHSFEAWVRLDAVSGCVVSKESSLRVLLSLCLGDREMKFSFSPYEFEGAKDTDSVEQVPQSLHGGLLATNEWVRVGYSLAVQKPNTQVTLYLNGKAATSQVFAGFVYMDSASQFYLGASFFSSLYLSGYLAEVTIYNQAVTPPAASPCPCTACSTAGLCLSPCTIAQYQSATGCAQCQSSCTWGCRGSTDCRLNTDPLCETYSDFSICQKCTLGAYPDSTGKCVCKQLSNSGTCCHPLCGKCVDLKKSSCTTCADGGVLLSGPPGECGCMQGFYMFQDIECRNCHSSCRSCTGPSQFQCTVCSTGSYLVSSLFCAGKCPTGFAVSESTCVSQQVGAILAVNFRTLAGPYNDTVANYTVQLGTQGQGAPAIAYQGGLAFNGTNLLAKLPPNSVDSRTILLAPVHEIALWVRLTVSSSGCLVSKSAGDSQLVALCLSSLALSLQVRLYNSSTSAFQQVSVAGSEVLSTAAWALVGYQVATQIGSDGVMKTVVNLRANGKLQATTFANTAFVDDTEANQLFLLGCSAPTATNCLKGQVAEVLVYNKVAQLPQSSCGCASCSSLGMCLSECVFGEYWAGACGPCQSACSGCVRSNSCKLSLDPLCKDFTDFGSCQSCVPLAGFDSAGTCQCVQLAGKDGDYCRCGEGATESSGQCVLCLNYLGAEEVQASMDKSFVKFYLTFKRSIVTLNLNTCDNIFQAVTLAKLGASPSCIWASDQSLTVLLGNGMTLASEALLLRSQSILAKDGPCTTNFVSLAPDLVFTVEWPKPNVVITAPSVYSTGCDGGSGLYLSATGTTNVKGQTPEFKWTFVLQPVGAKLSQSTDYSPNNYEITLENKYLVGKSLDVTLYVRTTNAGESSATASIKLTTSTVLSVSTNVGASTAVEAGKATSFTGVTAETCGVDVNAVQYTWTAAPAPAGLTFPAVVRTLVLPARTLTPGTKYTFTVTALFQGISGTSTVAVTVTASPISVVFDRSSGDQPLDSDLVIDGSGSSDPNSSTSTLTYTWTCDQCKNAQSQPLSLDSTSAKLSIPKSQLLKDAIYPFTLRVSSGSVAGEAQITIRIVGAAGAKLKIPWSSQRVSATERVTIVPSIDSSDLVSAYWSQTSGPSLKFVTPSNVAWLEIRSGLVQGTQYGLQLTVVTSIGSVSQNLQVDVNANPTSGRCVVSPGSGLALSTKWKFTCAGWEDPDNTDYPLQFQYGVIVSDRLWQLSAPSALGDYTTILYPGVLRVQANICDSLQGCATFALTVGVGQPTGAGDLKTVKANFQKEVASQASVPPAVLSYAFSIASGVDAELFQLLVQATLAFSTSVTQATNDSLNLLLTATMGVASLTNFATSTVLKELGDSILAVVTVLKSTIKPETTELAKIVFAAVPMTDARVVRAVSNYLTSLSTLVGIDTLPGADLVTVSSGNTTVVSKSLLVTSADSLSINSSNLKLTFPPTFLADMNIPTNSVADLRVSTFITPDTPAPILTCSLSVGGTASGGNLNSEPVKQVPVSGLSSPISLTTTVSSYNSSQKYSAYYLNEESGEWSTSNVSLSSISANEGTILTTHFSTFKIDIRPTLNVSLSSWPEFSYGYDPSCGSRRYVPILVNELLLFVFFAVVILLSLRWGRNRLVNFLFGKKPQEAAEKDSDPSEDGGTSPKTVPPSSWLRSPSASTTVTPTFVARLQWANYHYTLGVIRKCDRNFTNVAILAAVTNAELMVTGLFFLGDAHGLNPTFAEATDAFTKEDCLRCVYGFLISQGLSFTLNLASIRENTRKMLIVVSGVLAACMSGVSLFVAERLCPEPASQWILGFLVMLGVEVTVSEAVVSASVLAAWRTFHAAKNAIARWMRDQTDEVSNKV